MKSLKRGALIVIEGCDKAGKTTQCRKLVENLKLLGITAQMLQFPDRSTGTGKIINSYLAKNEELSDQAIHLLFSANRWESQPRMKKFLQDGITLIVDRYSFSGVAYSAAKPGMDFEWCKKPESGLPKPDLVFLLQASTEGSSQRAGFGDERYENYEFLQAVNKNYLKMVDESWILIDANKGIDELNKELLDHVKKIIEKVESKELQELW